MEQVPQRLGDLGMEMTSTMKPGQTCPMPAKPMPSSAEIKAMLKKQCSDKVDMAFETCEKDCTKKVMKDATGKGGANWAAIGMLILWFVIFVVIFWLILYSLKPTFVLVPGTTNVDSGRVLLFSVLAALILVIIIWLIRALMRP